MASDLTGATYIDPTALPSSTIDTTTPGWSTAYDPNAGVGAAAPAASSMDWLTGGLSNLLNAYVQVDANQANVQIQQSKNAAGAGYYRVPGSGNVVPIGQSGNQAAAGGSNMMLILIAVVVVMMVKK